MSFDWLKFLELGEHLVAARPLSQEASERTAVSRAYYAAFNLTANRLETKTPVEWRRAHRASDHAELAKYLQKFGATKKARVGLNLSRLYESRCKADYDNEVSNPSKLAEASIALAREVVGYLPNI